jgi:drug/metabolite transporter (DMT)-like permease
LDGRTRGVGGAGHGGRDLDPSLEGYGWLAGIVVVSTVGAVGLFFAGLRRVGPTATSILSTVEPLVTVGLAFLAFGESLGPTQLAGGALVLLAAVTTARSPRSAGSASRRRTTPAPLRPRGSH